MSSWINFSLQYVFSMSYINLIVSQWKKFNHFGNLHIQRLFLPGILFEINLVDISVTIA